MAPYSFWTGPSVEYHRIASSPSEKPENDEEQQASDKRSSGTTRVSKVVALLATTIVILLTYILVSHTLTNFRDTGYSKPVADDEPSFRREWRSLAKEEKLKYVKAVKCLKEQPSRIGLNQSLYDDFPRVHSQVGAYSHESAAFLAWHRYFLHTYETALRQQCHYNGWLPYWDWTLDWEDITKAPVWDDTYGFGGTGDLTKDVTLLDGRCVTTGPFANLEVLYVKSMELRHCLSRGLLDPESSLMHDLRDWIRPSIMADILSDPKYETFNLRLEENSHIAIPRMVRGDFLLLTAPFDPVFFLHHAQLDRIWFKWQQFGAGRKEEYEGLAAHNVTKRASLHDIIPMGGLAPDIEVSRIMDTRAGLLNYVYF